MAITPEEAFKVSKETINEFTSNSFEGSLKETTNNESTKNEKTDETIIARATVRTPTKAEKFKKSIFATAAKDVGSYMLFDVLIPAIKNTFRDLVCNTMDMALYGEVRGGRRTSSASRISDRGSIRDYESCYGKTERRSESRGRSIDTFTFNSFEAASNVLEHMRDIAEEYDGVCSLRKFNSMVGHRGDYTDQDYGWTHRELRYASVVRLSTGEAFIDIGEAKLLR